MPDFSALGVITPEDVLDHRALGYSYDVQAVVGIALDRTGSMTRHDARSDDVARAGRDEVGGRQTGRVCVPARLRDGVRRPPKRTSSAA